MQKKCRKCKTEKETLHFPRMNLGKYGVGSTCNECNNQNKKYTEIKKTPVKQIGKKRKERIKEQGSEMDVFVEIWLERKRICENCRKPIQLFHSSVFAHGLNKRDFQEQRYQKENIHLVHGIFEVKNSKTGETYQCHKEFDAKFKKKVNKFLEK